MVRYRVFFIVMVEKRHDFVDIFQMLLDIIKGCLELIY